MRTLLFLSLLLSASVAWGQESKEKPVYDFVRQTEYVERADRTYDRYRYEFIIKDTKTGEEKRVTFKFAKPKTKNELEKIVNDYDYEKSPVIYADHPGSVYEQ